MGISLYKIRITTAMKVETNIIASITESRIGLAVKVVIMYVDMQI